MTLALAATDAASGGGLAFRRSRSSAIDPPERSTEDLGLDPADTERCAWRDRNKALEEAAAAAKAAEEASA